MARKIHTVKPGDTLQNVSRLYYGSATETEQIINTNAFLGFRRTSRDTTLDGVPNLHPGDVLTLVLEDSTATPPQGNAADEISLFLDDNKVSLPDGSRLTRYFDGCCSVFNANFGWDPENKVDRAMWGDPRALAECIIFAGGKQIFGGKGVKSRNNTTADTSRMMVEIKSHTYQFLKSVMPSTRYPVERENEDLFELAQWSLEMFGLYAQEQSDNRERFKKVAAKKEGNLYHWLSNLANTRGRVLSATDDGHGLNIWNPTEAENVGHFVEGEAGFNPPQIEFDTSKIHNTYISSIRRAKKHETRGYRDYGLLEQSYAYLDIPGATAGNLQESLEYAARKKYRDFFSFPFDPGGTLLNPKGELWAPGQVVTLRAPSSRIYKDMDFLVRNTTYVLDVDKRSTQLQLVPPWVYMLPEDAAAQQEKDLSMWG